MITLRACDRGDPFEDHPQLASIWPEPFAALAREGVAETLGEGGVYLIESLGRVVGITGFYTLGSKPSQPLYLRWHGVMQSARNQGISPAAIAMVLEQASKKWPKATQLIEMAPVWGAYGEDIERHFKKMGFRISGAPEACEWSKMDWVPMSADIASFQATWGARDSDASRPAPPKPRAFG